MQVKPKVGILSSFGGSDEAYSVVNVARTQLEMLIAANYYPVMFVCPSFTGTGVWADNHVEIRKTIIADAKAVDIATCLRPMIGDINVMICHDLAFLSQHVEWAQAIRFLAKDYPNIRWLHWQHSRGDHSPIEPIPNSEYCYPNKGDLSHVAYINSTTMEHVFYVPHTLDIAYLGWPKLAVQIAEEYGFPFVDMSMIYPSRLDRQKQIERAMRLFAGLKKAGKSICLLIGDAYATGQRFKEYKEDCMTLSKELGFTDKEFAFLGEVYDECVVGTPRMVVKALFEMANLFLQVSTSETSSLVAMEAALAGNLLVLNSDFQPIHHLYNKALTLSFGSIFTSDFKYYRTIRTADGSESRIEDPQAYFDDSARNLIIPVLDSQINIAVKRQQLRERWPSRVMKEYLEPLILKDWNPKEITPKCEGDPDVTAIITTLDNLPMLQKQINVMMKECGSIIVVNNGSKDGTKEWLETNPVIGMKLIHRENMGAGPGRNAGLTLWDAQPTAFTLMLDGGILPPLGGIKAMKSYLQRHPEVSVISPEIASCYTTEEDKATFIFNKETIDDNHTFYQSCLSGTAYCLCKAEAWKVRFSEDGPFGEPGWGVDDNDMQYRWNFKQIKHIDFTQEEGMILFRKASGSFKRLFEETGVWPNQHGSVYEKRLVKTYQDYPQYCYSFPKVSCVVLGWNEYPLIAKVVKSLHNELIDIPHEIIVVNNGSTDGTQKWMDMQSLRQHHGDITIDTITKEVIKRTPENEEYWTGNFINISLPDNTGTGHGFNVGMEKARGQYIFYICGDMLPTKGSVRALIEYLDTHPDISYAGINAWVNENDLTKELPEFKELGLELGLGNYAYSYAVIRKEMYDNGVRFADKGPFEGAGCGYEEIEFANMMYSKGYKAIMFNNPAYLHERRDGKRSGLEEHGIDERKSYLKTRWNEVEFDIVHHVPAPERHLRRVAVMNNLVPDHPGPAGYLAEALRNIGCQVEQYNTHEDISQMSYDNYIFVDDGDGNHFDCPEWARPSKYWAIDMVIPGNDYLFTPNIDGYIEHGKTFDEFYATTFGAVGHAKERELNAIWLPMACNPEVHKPIEEEKIWDWVACWHNCGSRIDYSNAALEKFPNGWVGYAEGDNYSIYMNKAKCALNVSRVNEVNLRVMEVMMMGVPLITDRVQGMDRYGFFENTHYLGHSSIEEMLEKIQWVKDHPQETVDMAYRARELVLSKHTYYHRALRMFA
jgi:glycosyltransferase involved in cell wall biosynthesis